MWLADAYVRVGVAVVLAAVYVVPVCDDVAGLLSPSLLCCVCCC